MEASFYPYLGALCWIGMLLMLGTLIRAKVPLFQKLLFPSSLIGGLIGFVLINLDLVGMPTSTGWKDITPNIFNGGSCASYEESVLHLPYWRLQNICSFGHD